MRVPVVILQVTVLVNMYVLVTVLYSASKDRLEFLQALYAESQLLAKASPVLAPLIAADCEVELPVFVVAEMKEVDVGDNRVEEVFSVVGRVKPDELATDDSPRPARM